VNGQVESHSPGVLRYRKADTILIGSAIASVGLQFRIASPTLFVYGPDGEETMSAQAGSAQAQLSDTAA
jgi:hypothetical protein